MSTTSGEGDRRGPARIRTIEEGRRQARPRVPPSDLEAERAMLGACLLSGSAREVMCDLLGQEDFYRPAHGHIAAAMCDLHEAGLKVDSLLVAGWIRDHLGEQALEECGGLAGLITLSADCPSTGSAPSYAARVWDRARRRRLLEVAGLAAEKAYDLRVPVEEAADDLRGWAEDLLPGGAQATPRTVDEFLRTPYEYRWLVPGTIERQDRIMVTSAESGGKSELLRQLAVQISAGINPFTWARTAPVDVLLIDAENPEPQLYRRLSALRKRLTDVHGGQSRLGDPPAEYDPARLHVVSRTEGANLLNRADQAWFAGLIDQIRPDLVVSGPIYKLMPPPKRDELEEQAFRFARFIDRMRARYDLAFILEAHSPLTNDGGRHRTLRPIGSSFWMRWADFGFGFRPGDDGAYDTEIWKGRDEERRWPRTLRRGRTWPWIAGHMADLDARDNPAPSDPAF